MVLRLPAASAAGHLVGRADQLARLARVLDEVTRSGTRFVLIGADAGAGKTTLVEAFAGQLNGVLADRKAHVLRGQSVPLGGDGLPYAPIVGALRALVGRYGVQQILDWAGAGRHALGALLPDVVEAPADSESIRLQVFEVVVRLLERAAELGPVVLLLEDLHWADESSRHLLRFLTRALTEPAVLIVATYRTDELNRRHPLRPFLAEVGRYPTTTRIDLPNLNRGQVAELLAKLQGQQPPASVVDLVLRRSEGVPYFVEELAQSTPEQCLDMPDTLRDALNVRVQRLSDSAQETLRLVAVGGHRVDHGLLAAVSVSTPAELEETLREAIDAAVLVADESGYSFRHALLREVINDDMLPGQQARLHARYAAVLEDQPDLMTLGTAELSIAHHWSAAHEITKAFTWSVTAARSGSPAHYEALKMYERALELWDRVADPVSVAGEHDVVLEQAARAAIDAGELERALTLINGSLAETSSTAPETRISRLAVKGGLLSGLMKPGAVEALTTAVDELPADASPKLRARVLDQLATLTMLAGGCAIPIARQAIEAASAAGSAAVESSARITVGTSLVSEGDEAGGLAELVRASKLTAGNTRTMLRFYINYSDALNLAGQHAAAVEQALSGIQVARTLGLERSMGAMLAGNAAEPLLALGEWDRALPMIERALELNPPAHHYVHLRLLLASLRVSQGQLEEADIILAEFRGLIATDLDAPQYTAMVIRYDSEHAIASGDYARAWFNMLAFLEHWNRQHVSRAYPVLATGAAAAAVLDRADSGGHRTAIVREALDRAEPLAVRAFWAPVINAELSDSIDGWRSAVDDLTRLHAPAQLLPYAQLRLAQHLVASRDRIEARQLLTAAAARAEALGAGLITARISALAQRAGFTTVPSGHSSNPLSGLTSRELEVLQLVADGRSNGEIGAALFISTKTASVHVSNILGKLGVTGRGEAAALAHRAGLMADPQDSNVISLRHVAT